MNDEAKKIGALVVTHGQLAQELITIAEIILDGEFDHLVPVSIGWHDEMEEAKAAITGALRQADQGRGVLILTDMFGGTPSNISMPLHKKGEVEIITGVNLPMVIKVAGQEGGESWEEMVNSVSEQGRSHISVAGQILGD
ncbi:MAG TPA: PTS sugar transporter subunit IIA [Acidobacteriota bacterium]|nr:PTS sugar transporter subunit IIA [Acidobacteriota bacterium]